MSVTFFLAGENNKEYLNFNNRTARILIEVGRLGRCDDYGMGVAACEHLPKIMEAIEHELYEPIRLNRYVCLPREYRSVRKESVDNVTYLHYGARILDMGASEEYLRRCLTELYELVRKAVAKKRDLHWG
ncbi:MAG: hypothetical protein MN733_10065 [Nitrososphaera sp.]|nr:hypothetical protein [Nitrososphaera sp.]